jgi:hypothetical protein
LAAGSNLDQAGQRVKTRTFRLAFVIAGLAIALPAASQLGHPAKGSWSGYWGPDESDQRRMLLLLDWAGNQISGTINPGRNGVEIDSAALDASTWTMTIEADMPASAGSGQSARFVATGKLENLGSWTNRRYSGTYRLGGETGTFSLSLN